MLVHFHFRTYQNAVQGTSLNVLKNYLANISYWSGGSGNDISSALPRLYEATPLPSSGLAPKSSVAKHHNYIARDD